LNLIVLPIETAAQYQSQPPAVDDPFCGLLPDRDDVIEDSTPNCRIPSRSVAVGFVFLIRLFGAYDGQSWPWQMIGIVQRVTEHGTPTFLRAK
jgi:hypothetical protein